MSTDETVGVVRPRADGRWVAAHGLGSYTTEVGVYDSQELASEAAGSNGRRVIVARLGESGWEAHARTDREAAAARVDIRVDWMHSGTVHDITLDDVQAWVLRWPDGHPMGVLRDLAAQPAVAAIRAARATLTEQGLLGIRCPDGQVLTSRHLAGSARVQLTTVYDMVQHAEMARTRLGAIVLDALAAGHMAHAVLVCGAAGRTAQDWPHVEHGPGCQHCLGQTYLGDQETSLTRATTVLVDPVGIVEIAARLDVGRGTVDQWQQRPSTGFPAPDAIIGGRHPAWAWATIEQWAASTGRR
ncbi:MAG: helix-turn-helix transcriptional regulator [Gammaproteobacteria bacterium]